MSRPSRADDEATGPAGSRRRYDSPVRRQQAADTRERILTAASAIVHGYPSWDWRELTFRAVAECAGVSQRTVYRYFATEQELHDAVMQQLEKEAHVSYEGLTLEDLDDVAGRVFASLSSFSVPWPDSEGALLDEDRRRQDAVLDAVAPATQEWSESEREMAAAVLDALWGVPTYKRLVASWRMSGPDATAAVSWVMGLVIEAIRQGRRPPVPTPARPKRAKRTSQVNQRNRRA